MLSRTAFTILLFLFPLSYVMGEEVMTLRWESLIHPFRPVETPYTRLSPDLRSDLNMLAEIRAAQAAEPGTPMASLAASLEDRLNKLDIDMLMESYHAYQNEIIQRGQMLVNTLDGRLVRMPGYALPLEFTGELVKEFLLVPYVGACIHVPPPPPNQILFITTREPFATKKRYDPVWVTGRIRVQPTNKQLKLTDGQDDIPVGYNLEANKIEPYQETERR